MARHGEDGVQAFWNREGNLLGLGISTRHDDLELGDSPRGSCYAQLSICFG